MLVWYLLLTSNPFDLTVHVYTKNLLTKLNLNKRAMMVPELLTWAFQIVWYSINEQWFSKILPSDLVFEPTWPIFELIQDYVKTNILTKFHDYWTINVTSRAYTRFF